MLGLTRDSLLGEDDVGLELDDLVAHLLDLLLLDLQHPAPILLPGDLDVGLGLSLLVLQRTIEQHDPRVLDSPPHLRVGHVLVDHDSVQHLGILNLSSGDLLYSSVPLDVDGLDSVLGLSDGSDGVESELAHEFRPTRGELGSDGGLDESEHFRVGGDVDGDRDVGDDLESSFESSLEGFDDDDWVDVSLEEGKGVGEDFSSWRGSREGKRVSLFVWR